MGTQLSQYYVDESTDWMSSIDFHIEEMAEMQQWLNSILRLDTIVNLAELVERQLTQLHLTRTKLEEIYKQIESLQQKLVHEERPVPNAVITDDVRKALIELRRRVHQAEKEFLDVKINCDEFIAGTIDIQSRNMLND